MNLTLLQDSTPDQEPIAVKDSQSYLRLDADTDSSQIQGMIVSARLEAENEHGRELSRKQWRLSLDSFPRGGRRCRGSYWMTPDGVPNGYGAERWIMLTHDAISLLDPLVSVDSFTYRKADGSEVALVENTDYIVDTDKHPGIVCPVYGGSWPTEELWPSSAVKIEFTAGYLPEECRATIKQGMMLLVSQWYEGRIPFEAIRFVAELPFSVSSLFRNNKLWRF